MDQAVHDLELSLFLGVKELRRERGERNHGLAGQALDESPQQPGTLRRQDRRLPGLVKGTVTYMAGVLGEIFINLLSIYAAAERV